MTGRFQGARTPLTYRTGSSDQSNRYKYFVQLRKIKLNIPVNFEWRRRDCYLVLLYTFIPWYFDSDPSIFCVFVTNYKLINTYCLVGFVAEDRMKVLDILDSCQSEPRETLKENTPALGKLQRTFPV